MLAAEGLSSKFHICPRSENLSNAGTILRYTNRPKQILQKCIEFAICEIQRLNWASLDWLSIPNHESAAPSLPKLFTSNITNYLHSLMETSFCWLGLASLKQRVTHILTHNFLRYALLKIPAANHTTVSWKKTPNVVIYITHAVRDAW